MNRGTADNIFFCLSFISMYTEISTKGDRATRVSESEGKKGRRMERLVSEQFCRLFERETERESQLSMQKNKRKHARKKKKFSPLPFEFKYLYVRT